MGVLHLGRIILLFLYHLDEKVRGPPQALEEGRLFLEDILALEGDDDPGSDNSHRERDGKIMWECPCCARIDLGDVHPKYTLCRFRRLFKITDESRMISYSNERCREKDHAQIGNLLHLFRNECKHSRNMHIRTLRDDIRLQVKR